jgi:uncharacterized repeat protein (TIGR02543 family)
MPTPQMTKLEVLLVGAGGSGSSQPADNTNGYASAGGGGEVTITDFTGSASPLTGTVPAPGAAGSVTDGTTVANAGNGLDGSLNGSGGASGNGNAGAIAALSPAPSVPYGGGGGAGGAAVFPTTITTNANGGAGVEVDSIAPVGSLFAGDTTCYGGGGAAGVAGVPNVDDVQGIPGCGGGAPRDTTATALTPPRANSGGGGGGINVPQTATQVAGARGVAVIRWAAPDVTLTFDANGHGTTPEPQTLVAGSIPAEPAGPNVTGYRFDGWFSDPALSTPASFTAPVTTSSTFYAKWTAVLAPTGVDVGLAQPAAALSALVAGIGLVVLAARRRRRQSD